MGSFPIDRHLKVVLIRAPLDVEVVEREGPCRRVSPLQAKLAACGPLESAACEASHSQSVAQVQSERHGSEVCNLRERDLRDLVDLRVLVSVLTERRFCHRRSPSAAGRDIRAQAEVVVGRAQVLALVSQAQSVTDALLDSWR